MTEISSTNNSKIISDSYDDIYDNEHSITTTGTTDGTTSQAIRNFLNATEIIQTDKQTTDIKQRKQNTIDADKSNIITQEIIDFCISEDGITDTDKLIACMNYICANLDKDRAGIYARRT
jgi:hypothetical protein